MRETKAPAVLVELGFIDNTMDNRTFEDNHNRIVNVLADSIMEFLGTGEEIEDAQTVLQAVQVLVREGVIGSPDYWLTNSREGKDVRGDYAAILLQRMAARLTEGGK